MKQYISTKSWGTGMGMTVIFFCSVASAMSLESFSRGNAGFGRSAANGTNFIGRSGNTGEADIGLRWMIQKRDRG
ncbi:hypothetical protein N7465_001329 [Penicillium sp. CMV-2018d]|nr:hypothetical protein N7465_001329 [Penicillium sp. CMV-2018d]